MKKYFKFMILALVAMCGFASCSEDCDHKFIEHDYSADLVGTWTCLQEGLADALVIKADGSVVSTGVLDGDYWDGVKGSIKTVNNKMTFAFEGGDNYETRFDIIPGVAFSIFNEEGERMTYNYCKEDLSDEIVGMWVCNDGPTDLANDMMIQTFNEDGSSVMTGHADEILVNDSSTTYKVVGDLLFLEIQKESIRYEAFRMTYSPNGTSFGDIMTLTLGINANIAPTTSWLRINEGLSFNAKPYAYNTAYISNVKGGKDEEFSILGHPFNMANVKAGDFDMLFHSELFCVDLKENHIKQLFRSNDQDIAIDIPITVEGNKVTLHMGTEDTKLKDVEVYMFQDADACQLHMYMHTDAFINYFANMEVISLQVEGKIGSTQAEIDAVYANMKARIEAINVSFVFKAIK